MRVITIIVLFMVSMNPSEEMVVRKAVYFPVEGTDREHGQGAIERNELPHCEVEPNVWFIRVPAPGSCGEWQARLNRVVDRRYGKFEVRELSEEEHRRIERGEVRFQQ